MKNLLLLSVFMLFSAASAQQHKSTLFGQMRNDLPVSVTLGFKPFESLHTLTFYDPDTMMTTKYTAEANGYYRSNAYNLPVSLNGIAVDSFNPNGAMNAQTFIGMGLLRTLFKL